MQAVNFVPLKYSYSELEILVDTDWPCIMNVIWQYGFCCKLLSCSSSFKKTLFVVCRLATLALAVSSGWLHVTHCSCDRYWWWNEAL